MTENALTEERIEAARAELGVFEFIGYDYEHGGEWRHETAPERLEKTITVSGDDQESEGETQDATFAVIFRAGSADVVDVRTTMDGKPRLLGDRGVVEPRQPGMLW